MIEKQLIKHSFNLTKKDVEGILKAHIGREDLKLDFILESVGGTQYDPGKVEFRRVIVSYEELGCVVQKK